MTQFKVNSATSCLQLCPVSWLGAFYVHFTLDGASILGTKVATLKLDSTWKRGNNELCVWELRIRWWRVTSHRTGRRCWKVRRRWKLRRGRRRRCNLDRPTEARLVVMLHRGFAGGLVVGGQEFGSKQNLELGFGVVSAGQKENRKPLQIALELRCELILVQNPLKIHGKCVQPLSSARSLDL